MKEKTEGGFIPFDTIVRRYHVHTGDKIKLETDSIDEAFSYYKSNPDCTHIWDNQKQDNIIWQEVVFG